MRTLTTAWLLVSFLLVGCGGEIHFVADRPVLVPPTPPSPAKTISESFYFATPSGVSSVAFVFYQSKTMHRTVERVLNQIPVFQDEFWATSEKYSETSFTVSLDTTLNTSWTFSPAREGLDRLFWQSRALNFFRTYLPQLQARLEIDGGYTQNPLAAFRSVQAPLLQGMASDAPPAWIHYVYFRDADIRLSEGASGFSQDEVRSLLQRLNQRPLSPFRYRIHSFLYGDASACGPAEAIKAKALMNALAVLRSEISDLCFVDGTSMRSLAQRIQAENSRIVIAKQPKKESLSVKISGRPVAREAVLFASENEITFADFLHPKPGKGDVVEVTYEPVE